MCVFTVIQTTLMFGPDVKLFYGTLSEKLFRYSIIVFQCSFWCLRGHYFDKKRVKCHRDTNAHEILDIKILKFSYVDIGFELSSYTSH